MICSSGLILKLVKRKKIEKLECWRPKILFFRDSNTHIKGKRKTQRNNLPGGMSFHEKKHKTNKKLKQKNISTLFQFRQIHQHSHKVAMKRNERDRISTIVQILEH